MIINRWIIPIIFDVFVCLLTIWFAYYLRMGIFYQLNVILVQIQILPIIVSIIILIPLLAVFSVYNSIKYSGLDSFIQLGKALFIYSIIFSTVFAFVGINDVPRTIGIIQPIFLSLIIFLSRGTVRYIINQIEQNSSKLLKQNLLIYGAGSAGRQLADLIYKIPNMSVVGFLDDNPNLWGHRINNKKIFNPLDLSKLTKKSKVDKIFIAIPSIKKGQHSNILSKLQKYLIPVKILPNINNIIDGQINLSNFKTPDFNDLLGRDVIKDHYSFPSKSVTGKTVLISGGGGSIGSEICRQTFQLLPKTIIILELHEYSLYKIKQELENFTKIIKIPPKLICFLGSIEDEFMVKNIISSLKPDIIFHAAAYKHLSIVENNPFSGIQNNVFGTLTIAKAAIKYNVSHFILISTDKAVRSTNIMGATKRLAEMALLALNKNSKVTKFSIVRFGNVLGSSGSVIPKFYQQILDGGPITLTHKNVKRFFMTISEAVQLVIETANLSKGGEIFILDMGKLIKIRDLAEKLINLSGKTLKDKNNPTGGIEIKITGLLPGEKLFEEVLITNNARKTSHPKILKATEKPLDWEVIDKELKKVKALMIKSNINSIKDLLVKINTGYQKQK